MLTLRDWPTLTDGHGLSYVMRIPRIMREVLFAAADVLTDARMLDIARHHDRDGVAHLVGNHNAAESAAFCG